MLLEEEHENDYIKKLTILYVEDNQEALNSLGSILKKRVKQLYTASNGEKGLEIFNQHHETIDIVITDIRMPYMNGITMVDHIKEINEHVKVIYISAHNEPDILLQAINAGADGFVVKPISVKTRLMSKLFQLSKEIYKDRLLEKYNKTLKLVLDCVDSIIIISDGKKMSSANEAFLDFFGFSSLQKFQEKHNCICDKFINESGFLKTDYTEDRTWLDVALEVDDPKVKIKGLNEEYTIFLVKVNPLIVKDENPLYVIEFTDITKFTDYDTKVHVDI
jgi:two-component system cell cycle response regulator